MRLTKPLPVVRVLPVVLLFAVESGFAQSPDPFAASAETGDEVLEEVVVIGSRIPRRDYISASPVVTVAADELQLNGSPTLTEYLNRYPQFRPAQGANTADLRAALDLRGLRPDRTLVLLNGERLAAAGTTNAPNIYVIPSSLVQRVEVLTGGASTVYGADAVAGAVNFATRRDYEGVEINTRYLATDRGDGETFNLSLTAGTSFAQGRGSISGFIEHMDRQFVPTSARRVTSKVFSQDFQTGDLVPGGSAFVPSANILFPTVIDGALAPRGVIFTESGDLRPIESSDVYNFNEFRTLRDALERETVALFTEYEITPGLRLRADAIYSDQQVEIREAGTVINQLPFLIDLRNPGISAQAANVIRDNAGPVDRLVLPIGWRSEAVGPRSTVVSAPTLHVNLSLEGEWFSDWAWDLSSVYSSNYDVVISNRNGLSQSRLQQALLVDPQTGECFDPSDGCVAANIFGEGNLSTEAADFIRAQDVDNKPETTMQVLSFDTHGELTLGSYSFRMALGAEWRSEEAFFTPDPRLSSGEVIFFGNQGAEGGERSVRELYGELLFPILIDRPFARSLELETGYRYSDYSTSGGTQTYKAGLLWQPSDSVLIRGMYQRAVRAPSLGELFSTRFESFFVRDQVFNDFCSASNDPVANGLSGVCISQGIPESQLGDYEANPFEVFTVVQGGEADIDPEEADTYTIGVTWQPDRVSGLSVSLDYYRIEVEDAIESFGAGFMFRLCESIAVPGDTNCRAVARGADFNVESISTQFQNIGSFFTEGVDLAVNGDLPLGTLFGQPSALDFSVNVNHTIAYDVLLNPLVDLLKCGGGFGDGCPNSFPEYRAYTRLGWSLGPVLTQLSWEFVDGMFNSAANNFGDGFIKPVSVDSYNYFDLTVRWQASEKLTLQMGVINLADKEPPILGGISAFKAINTDPRQYDVLGRRFSASLNLRL